MKEDSSKEFDLIPGQILQCEIAAVEGEGLYRISSEALGSLTGMLRSTGELMPGTKLEACFVCMHQGTAVFMPREPMQNLSQQMLSNADQLSVPEYVEEDGFNVNMLELVLNYKGIPTDKLDGLLTDLKEQKTTIETFLERTSLLSAQQCNSISRGKALMDRGAITWGQFAIAFFDEVHTGIKLEESLTVRGWL